MADPQPVGQQLTVDKDGNITTLAPPPPDVPERVAPDLLEHSLDTDTADGTGRQAT